MKDMNFSSCPGSFGKCYCEVNIVSGIMKAVRFTEPCISAEGCNTGTFTFEGELDPSKITDFDEANEIDERERFEGNVIFYDFRMLYVCRLIGRRLRLKLLKGQDFRILTKKNISIFF